MLILPRPKQSLSNSRRPLGNFTINSFSETARPQTSDAAIQNAHLRKPILWLASHAALPSVISLIIRRTRPTVSQSSSMLASARGFPQTLVSFWG